MAAKSNVPVIIKRKRIVRTDGGHHGGAWKVAYADFVTAMMAFFMLMWLLSTTTQNQRQGLADYFNPTVPIQQSSGGNGALGGDSVFTEETMARSGTGASASMPTAENRARGETGVDPATEAGRDAADLSALAELERKLVGSGGESLVSSELMRHVVTRQTDEGLVVELFDLPGAPLFAPGASDPTAVMLDILDQLAPVLNLVRNDIAVRGHLAARPLVVEGASPWDLSSMRADEVRRRLGAAGLAPDRVERVSGYADRRPAARNPMAERNNRVEIVLLRRQG